MRRIMDAWLMFQVRVETRVREIIERLYDFTEK